MNLRALAKDYANGVLGHQAYRKARDELIANILTGHAKVTAHDFQPPLNTQRIEVEADITRIQTSPGKKKPDPTPSPTIMTPDPLAPQEHTASTHWGILVAFTAIIVLLVIIVAFYPYIHLKKPASDDTQITSPDNSGTQPDMQHPDAMNAGPNLIKKFLLQNDWTDGNLQQFISAWQGLSAEERDIGLASSAKTELANAIYRRLDEERIMLGLGDVQSSIDKQTILVTFAQQMGINDPRIFVKETP